MTITVLDDEVNKYYEDNLLLKDKDTRKPIDNQKDGVKLSIFNSDNTSIFKGTVWPNEQYEYDADKGGEYKICISVTDGLFIENFSQIKTQVKFASEFHRDKKDQKKGQEVHHAEKQKEDEN